MHCRESGRNGHGTNHRICLLRTAGQMLLCTPAGNVHITYVIDPDLYIN